MKKPPPFSPRKKRIQKSMRINGLLMALLAGYCWLNTQVVADMLFQGDLQLTQIAAGALSIAAVAEFILAQTIFNPKN